MGRPVFYLATLLHGGGGPKPSQCRSEMTPRAGVSWRTGTVTVWPAGLPKATVSKTAPAPGSRTTVVSVRLSGCCVCMSLSVCGVSVCASPAVWACQVVGGTVDPDTNKAQRVEFPSRRSSHGWLSPSCSPRGYTKGPEQSRRWDGVTRTKVSAESDWVHSLGPQAHLLSATGQWSKHPLTQNDRD